MFIHDIIKIKYIREGFLPDYPYHLISDEEMFGAFYTKDQECFFTDTYPCPGDKYQEVYDQIITEFQYHIQQYLDPNTDIDTLPSWVYSYMIGSVIGPNSDTYDIQDMLKLLGLSDKGDHIPEKAYDDILEISLQYIKKMELQSQHHRPPTIFGELHIIKVLRLEQVVV